MFCHRTEKISRKEDSPIVRISPAKTIVYPYIFEGEIAKSGNGVPEIKQRSADQYICH